MPDWVFKPKQQKKDKAGIEIEEIRKQSADSMLPNYKTN
jgi:hypothetical protein